MSDESNDEVVADSAEEEAPEAEAPAVEVPSIEALVEAGELPGHVLGALQAEQARAQEAEDRMLRAVAEADNQKKRIEREYAERARFANEGVLNEMLGVFDSLELGLAQVPAGEPGGKQEGAVAELRKGVELALSQFLSAFENSGVTPIDAEVGAAFDPKVHEAMIKDDEVDQPANTLARVLQRGFRYHDRILRPTRVIVATGKGHSG